jgi:hypothetical protein
MGYCLGFLENTKTITNGNAMLCAAIEIYYIPQANRNFVILGGNDGALYMLPLGSRCRVGHYGLGSDKRLNEVARLNGIEGIEDTDNGRCWQHTLHSSRSQYDDRRPQKLAGSRLIHCSGWSHDGELHTRVEVFIFSRIYDHTVCRCDMLSFFKGMKNRG